MSVFKRKYKNKTGAEKAISNYTVEFRDHNDIVRRVVAFPDKSASKELERQLKRLVSLRMAGAEPDVELSRFLESAPLTIRERLGEWGVLSGPRAKAGKKLSALIEVWGIHLRNEELTESHCRESVANVLRVVKETGITHWTELTGTIAKDWLAKLRKSGASIRTRNSYLAKMKAFCNWMVSIGAATSNPLALLKKMNEATDKRRERHALTPDELAILLAAAEAGGVVHGMDGHTRALLYHMAATTGLRWSELRSLTRASFSFGPGEPAVTIKAGDAKNELDDVLPLPLDLAAKLKEHMALFLPGAKAFPGMWKGKGAEMLYIDLEAAGILSRLDDENRTLVLVDEYGLAYDFHCLRTTFATMLRNAGVSLVTA